MKAAALAGRQPAARGCKARRWRRPLPGSQRDDGAAAERT